MRIHIIFGTESGESELVAEEIAEEFEGSYEVEISDMADIDIQSMDPTSFHIVVCSTYGEGELPSSAKPFHEALSKANPDLSSLRYAIFGRGDSTYVNTYSRGSEIIDELLTKLGGTRIGEYGRDDASDWDAPEDYVTQWSQGIIRNLENERVPS